jgi:hypothetical protein
MSVVVAARAMARRMPSRDQAKSRISRPSANVVNGRGDEPSSGWTQMFG